MHSLSSVWWIGPFLSLVAGVILIGQGLWRSIGHDSLGRGELSKAAIFRLRAGLFSSGLFVLIISAVLAFGLGNR